MRGALKRVQFCSGQNCEAEVISSEFVGKTMLQQHQIVYHTLGGKMGNEIHALSLRTQAPGE
ncbi:MAG: BolA family transcriptional regulator [Gammaproteobacteria bacterium]|nr:BolA family transcriptional regulator [Gammaproteobacteria bacterium]